jgi:hypothetical protein
MAARTLRRSDHLVQQFPEGDCCLRACGRAIEHGKVSRHTGTPSRMALVQDPSIGLNSPCQGWRRESRR